MGNKDSKGNLTKKPPTAPKSDPKSTGPNGSKNAQEANKKPIIPNMPANKTNEADFDFLVDQTGLSKDEIKKFFDEFNKNNPDGKLDKKEFITLYCKLRPEPKEYLDEISEYVFRAFDADNNGYLSFSEFMVAYALTTRGDLKKKLEYAFKLYDADRNGYLDKKEISAIVYGMLDLLGADRKLQNSEVIAEECIKELDTSNDGKISKDEFINGLMKNYSLRALMSPFN